MWAIPCCDVLMQLLIGYETGLAVLWDLREKTAESRYNAPEVRIKRTSLENTRSI